MGLADNLERFENWRDKVVWILAYACMCACVCVMLRKTSDISYMCAYKNTPCA